MPPILNMKLSFDFKHSTVTFHFSLLHDEKFYLRAAPSPQGCHLPRIRWETPAIWPLSCDLTSLSFSHIQPLILLHTTNNKISDGKPISLTLLGGKLETSKVYEYLSKKNLKYQQFPFEMSSIHPLFTNYFKNIWISWILNLLESFLHR